MNAPSPAAAPNPYGATPTGPSVATLRGASGQYTIRPGSEVRVGRDPARCQIFLAEPRISGVHATLKLEGGQLFVRDETSNNGTWISGSRIAPGAWTGIPSGAILRFGPVEFGVELEG
jgi:pSer/pThr/pTyr-binding forkhead associated (FHA) protein